MFFRTLLFLMNFLYFPLVTVSIGVFSSLQDPFSSISYIASQPDVPCEDISLILRVIVILAYVIGIFALFAVLLYLSRNASSRTTRRSIRQYFGFFFLQYRHHWTYMALVILSRRVLFALLNTLIPEKSIILFTVNMLVLLFSLLMVLYIKPYKTATDNYLDIISTVLLMISYSVAYGQAATHSLATWAPHDQWSLGDVAVYIIYIIIQAAWGFILVSLFSCYKSYQVRLMEKTENIIKAMLSPVASIPVFLELSCSMQGNRLLRKA
eukprot:TRINITY_DN20995_c0_g1_i1.p1 TRINITY_DN20995_c0_g1~~TRINITY_DN20995_c0_g1_i1.p1  ORF type:complete len:267 (+),score=21.21 TRINITY_DN20995_c0_g1_i1:245-1045(+)